jgi:CHASE2 domain-containing sensor protein
MKKPLHKHISHQARRVHGKITKYLTERDTMFATLWVFVFIIVLGSIPLNLGIMNPVKLGLKDFDFNDITYSKLGKGSNSNSTPFDPRITIIDIGDADRGTLAMMIDKAGSMNPKVMALDVLFDEEKDPVQDSMLNETFKRNKKLIAASHLISNTKEFDTIQLAGNYFKTASSYAFANFFNDTLATIRYYDPFIEDYRHIEYPAFSTAIVKAYGDEEAYKKLEAHSHHTLINYSRPLDRYYHYTYDQLLTDQFDPSRITGKIVLFGYLGKTRWDIGDRKFTPMNERFAGKSIPDMDGIVVHANIISMALDKSYIKKVPLWANWLLAILVCWLHMSFFIHYYLESHIWFHLAAKIAQVLSGIFFIWLGIYIYDKYRVKVDMKMSIVVIIMAVDVIYFYEAWAVWMHKKFHYRTVFKPHHH